MWWSAPLQVESPQCRPPGLPKGGGGEREEKVAVASHVHHALEEGLHKLEAEHHSLVTARLDRLATR
eukprot:4469931-Pyramimonas_sp.AAC.1